MFVTAAASHAGGSREGLESLRVAAWGERIWFRTRESDERAAGGSGTKSSVIHHRKTVGNEVQCAVLLCRTVGKGCRWMKNGLAFFLSTIINPNSDQFLARNSI